MNLNEALDVELKVLGKSLTPKYLAFAIGLAAGLTLGEAYEAAQYKARGTKATQSASRLLSTNVNIQRYVETAKAIAVLASQAALIGSVDQKRRLLWDMALVNAKVVEVPIKGTAGEGTPEMVILGNVDAVAAKGCINELNKMDGDLAVIKKEISGDVKVNSGIDLTDLNKDERAALRKIIARRAGES